MGDESSVGFRKFGGVGSTSQVSHFIPGPGPGPSGLTQYYASRNSNNNNTGQHVNLNNTRNTETNVSYMDSGLRQDEKQQQYKESVAVDVNTSVYNDAKGGNNERNGNGYRQNIDQTTFDSYNFPEYQDTSTTVNASTTIPKTTIEEDDEDENPSPTAESKRN